MKSLFDEYYKILMYTIFGIILVMSSYIIILNIHHYNSLNSTIIVSEIDSAYQKFMNNVTKLENNINDKMVGNDNIKLYFSKTLTILKNGGVFRILPHTKLKYNDLYNLNTYFIEELINKCWVSVFQNLDISKEYHDIVSVLINNANYMNDYLSKDSLILHESSNESRIINDYHMIINNYAMFSNVILDMNNSLVGVKYE